RSSPIPISSDLPGPSAPRERASRTSTISLPLWPRLSDRPGPRCSSCAWACCRRGSCDTPSMRRPVDGLIAALACVLLASSLEAQAQSPTAWKRVALLVPAVWDPTHPQIMAFQQEDREDARAHARAVAPAARRRGDRVSC